MSAAITQIAGNNASVYPGEGSLVQPLRAGGKRRRTRRGRTRKHIQRGCAKRISRNR